ncbi:unnamed protein product [Symbiodinium microadriaticum]|nr:unnamed protein product [Symbiodinium microadriaticum]
MSRLDFPLPAEEWSSLGPVDIKSPLLAIGHVMPDFLPPPQGASCTGVAPLVPDAATLELSLSLRGVACLGFSLPVLAACSLDFALPLKGAARSGSLLLVTGSLPSPRGISRLDAALFAASFCNLASLLLLRSSGQLGLPLSASSFSALGPSPSAQGPTRMGLSLFASGSAVSGSGAISYSISVVGFLSLGLMLPLRGVACTGFVPLVPSDVTPEPLLSPHSHACLGLSLPALAAASSEPFLPLQGAA